MSTSEAERALRIDELAHRLEQHADRLEESALGPQSGAKRLSDRLEEGNGERPLLSEVDGEGPSTRDEATGATGIFSRRWSALW